MVTASYLSPGLKEQHSAAVAAGVTVVNEVRSRCFEAIFKLTYC